MLKRQDCCPRFNGCPGRLSCKVRKLEGTLDSRLSLKTLPYWQPASCLLLDAIALMQSAMHAWRPCCILGLDRSRCCVLCFAARYVRLLE